MGEPKHYEINRKSKERESIERLRVGESVELQRDKIQVQTLIRNVKCEAPVKRFRVETVFANGMATSNKIIREQ